MSEVAVYIKWAANPFRGEQFEEQWRPAAAAALDFGATHWAFYRSLDGRLDFFQIAHFPSAKDFERYWYSEEISEARAKVVGWFPVPILPAIFEISGSGQALPAEVAPDITTP